jgi:hypothetical protein
MENIKCNEDEHSYCLNGICSKCKHPEDIDNENEVITCLSCDERYWSYCSEWDEDKFLCKSCHEYLGEECTRRGYKEFIFIIQELIEKNNKVP